MVVSWWGQANRSSATDTQGVNTDQALAHLLAILEESDAKVKVAFHLEPYPDRTVATIKDDLAYIHRNYGHYECLYHIRGLPVYYVYDSYHISSQDWSRLLSKEGDLSVRNSPFNGTFIGLWVEGHHGQELVDGHFDGELLSLGCILLCCAVLSMCPSTGGVC